MAIYVLPGHHISILFTLSSKNTNFQNLRLRSTSPRRAYASCRKRTCDKGSYCAIRIEDGNVRSIRRLYVISAILIYCTTYSCCVLYNYTDRKSTKCTKMGGVQYL